VAKPLKQVDKIQLTEHLDTCIQVSESKEEKKVSDVLRNLKQEINDGAFDYGALRD
jgi:hypothetical protein